MVGKHPIFRQEICRPPVSLERGGLRCWRLDYRKGGIYDFLDESKKVVDCKNSDPGKLCATLCNLDQDSLLKVSKIVLYDDAHSASA